MIPPGPAVTAARLTPPAQRTTLHTGLVRPLALRAHRHVSGDAAGRAVVYGDGNALAWYESVVPWLTLRVALSGPVGGLIGQHDGNDSANRHLHPTPTP